MDDNNMNNSNNNNNHKNNTNNNNNNNMLRFVIPSRNLKVFSKIIQCMAKIGDDLFLDVKIDKV